MLKRLLLGATLLAFAILVLHPPGLGTVQAQVQVVNVCLRQWTPVTEDGETIWKPYEMGKAIGWLDLRSIPEHGNALDPGFMLITYDEATAGTDLRACFGSDIDRVLKDGERMVIRSLLDHKAEVLPGTTLRTAVRDWFSILADPTGQVNTKPLMPNSNRVYGPFLKPYGRLYTERFTMAHHYAADFVLKVIHEDYKRLLQDVQDLKLDAVVLRKMVGAWKEKYKLDCADFVPDGSLDIGCQSPTTTITEAWGCGDSDDPDCDLDWVEVAGDLDIVSSTGRTGSSVNMVGRANSNLSTDDHYAQADLVISAVDTGTPAGGTLIRRTSANQAGYGIRITEADVLEIQEFTTGGSPSVLASSACTIAVATTYTVKIEMSGSDLTADVTGGSTCSDTASDATITGNVQTGLRGRNNSAVEYIQWDNFEAADVSAAARRIIFISRAPEAVEPERMAA